MKIDYKKVDPKVLDHARITALKRVLEGKYIKFIHDDVTAGDPRPWSFPFTLIFFLFQRIDFF